MKPHILIALNRTNMGAMIFAALCRTCTDVSFLGAEQIDEVTWKRHECQGWDCGSEWPYVVEGPGLMGPHPKSTNPNPGGPLNSCFCSEDVTQLKVHICCNCRKESSETSPQASVVYVKRSCRWLEMGQ